MEMVSMGFRQAKWIGVIVFLAIYAVALYFQSATASLHDRYQPGIEFLQMLVSPALMLIVSAFLALMITSRRYRSFLKSSYLGCAVIGVLLGAFVFFHESRASNWASPEGRTMLNTLHASLFSPSFSNRSVVVVLGNALFSFALLGWFLFLGRRDKPSSINFEPRQKAY
ncbi:hypothetical protein [Alcanivorax jadensis]|uniref:hypothetical protein n=1 Tax=Alcanivorax jadensis TaxID=64988 RepID=UPI0026F0197E|nr:hypothetical protein [Alcanivorax jadensis]